MKHATAAYNRKHENKLSVSQVVFCLYMGVLQRDPMPKLCFVCYCIWVYYSGILCQNCVLFVIVYGCVTAGSYAKIVFCLFIVYGCVTAGSYAKIVFCLLLYMGVLQRGPMPKLCFVKVLISCKDILQIVRIFFVMILQIGVVPG